MTNYPAPQDPGMPPQPGMSPPGKDQKLTAGLLGILLGGFGAHRFYLGDTNGGLLRIGIMIVTCGLGGVIGLIEGIIYLTKSDAEFYQTYVVQKKAWF